MTNTASPGSPSEGEHPTVLDPTHARQGRRGRHVLWVLAISLVLVALALFGAWAVRSPDLASTEPHNARQPADAQAFSAPEPAPKQTDVMVAPGVAGETSPASPVTQNR